MEILVCRVAWMPYYRSDIERAVGGGSYVDQGNVPHESLNFQPIGETYYGYVRVVGGGRIRIERIGAERGDDTVSDVLVVFCAEHPGSGDFLVVGWYNDATVYRHGTQRPGPDRPASFTTVDAMLVAEYERCFRIPRAQENPPSDIGGIGQVNIWYGLNNKTTQDDEEVQAFRERLVAYIGAVGAGSNRTPEDVAVEGRQRRRSERLERRGSNRRFIDRKGYRCEACDWSIDEDERDVWGSSFELHHLTPVHELQENDTRVVRAGDFAVLCASCHRAIHRTEFISDIAGFAERHGARTGLRVRR